MTLIFTVWIFCTLIASFLCYQILGDVDPNHPLTRPTTPGTRGADAAAQGYIIAAAYCGVKKFLNEQ